LSTLQNSSLPVINKMYRCGRVSIPGEGSWQQVE
jgi:hypothetical protein